MARADRKRWWVVGAILAVLVVLEIKRSFFPKVETPRLLTAPVEVADVEQTVLASGTIEPYKLVSVGA